MLGCTLFQPARVRRARLFIGLLALLIGSVIRIPALACEIYDDADDHYALGRYLIGSVHPELRMTAAFNSCRSAVAGCLYTAADGLIYGIWDADDDKGMASPEILRIEADKGFRGSLLAGIKIGDSLATVRRKVMSLPSGFPLFEDDTDTSNYMISRCHILSSNGATWSYILYFDAAARLEGVVAADEDPAKIATAAIFAIQAGKTPGSSGDDSRPFTDVGGRLAIGKTPMGGRLGPRPALVATWQKCRAEDDKYSQRSQFVDCRFTDTDGVVYDFTGDRNIENSFIVYAAAATISSGYRGSLIAGVAFGDSLAVVRHKLEKLPRNFPGWNFSQRDGEGAKLESDYAISGHNEPKRDVPEWGYHLGFDLFGRLISASTSYDPDVD
jgi:hypothetical protein